MTIGEYAGVPLQDIEGAWQNGAVFLLRQAPYWSESVTIDGWTTSVVAKVPAVVTCGPTNAQNYEDAHSVALTAANRGLDYLSVIGKGDCAIRDPSDDCLVWWPDKSLGGIILRYRMIQNDVFPVRGLIVASTAESDGAVVPPPPPQTPMAREAYRFIRMARTSDDLYDSYRNMFLALECVLSDIRPPRQITTRQGWGCLRWGRATTRRENETQWFRAALIEADKLVPLGTLTKPGDHTNHLKWIMKRMYSRERCALMHAKQDQGNDYLLPQDQIPRADLTASLGRLWNYTSNLVREHYGVTGRRFDLSAVAMAPRALEYLRNSVVVVSDDETSSVCVPGVGSPIADGANVVELESGEAATDPHQRRVWTFLAHCRPSELTALTAVRKVGARYGDQPAQSVSELLGPLRLGDSVVRFEVVYGNRYVNPAIAPSQFSS